MAERHAQILGELAAFGLDLARKLRGQAMAAETPEETAGLAKAFHSVSRSVRQTLALEARLDREARVQAEKDQVEREALERNARRDAQQAADAPVVHRISRIEGALKRIVYAEYEDEAEALFDEIEDRVRDDAREPGFLEEALDDQVVGLCKDFGLPPPPRPLVRPPDPPEPAPPVRAHALADWTDPT